MPILKCKICGGDMEISADKTFGICEYCGSTMTLPRVDDEQRAAAFDRSNHFCRIGEFMLSMEPECILPKQYEQFARLVTDCQNLLGAWMNSERREDDYSRDQVIIRGFD